MNTNIYRDFQICISVPLSSARNSLSSVSTWIALQNVLNDISQFVIFQINIFLFKIKNIITRERCERNLKVTDKHRLIII